MNACIEMPFGIKMVITCQFLLIFLPSCYNTLECSVNFIFIVRQLLFGIFLVFFCKKCFEMYKTEIYFLGQKITFLDFFITFFLEKKWQYSVCSFQLDNYFLGFFNIFSLIFFGEKKNLFPIHILRVILKVFTQSSKL